MNAFDYSPPNMSEADAVAAYLSGDRTPSTHAVVDAIDELQHQLGAYRALAHLVANNRTGGQEGLDPVQRSDLATLLGVLNNNLAAHCAKAREAAVSFVKDPDSRSTQGT